MSSWADEIGKSLIKSTTIQIGDGIFFSVTKTRCDKCKKIFEYTDETSLKIERLLNNKKGNKNLCCGCDEDDELGKK